ncbi:MAG TPA: AAA family ATPase, partial [Myxococcaceae bacterium]|nr:AAA family ATPase [Myxococcaceae bacterium]
MVDSSDFAQALAEAHDISRSVNQKPTSAHALLALFTFQNRAALLLRERSVDEDALLTVMTSSPKEADAVLRDLCERAREIARSCGSQEADCLHFLIALTRVRCAAQELLSRTGLDLTSLRNTALSYYLSGRMPRRFQMNPPQPGTPPVPAPPRAIRRPLGSPPAPLPVPRQVTVKVAEPLPTAAPAPLPRELFDTDEEISQVTQPPPFSRVDGRAAIPHFPALEPKLFPLLTSLGRNLSLAAAEGRLDPVVGRAKEIEEVIDVLGKRRTNNPCLLGEPGVGKTAVVEGVAQRLLSLRGMLAQKVVVELDMASLVAGTQLRGSFSERLNGLKEEVRRAGGRVVVFIDELHTLIGAGSTGEGPQDAANELKSAMARGEFPCIGANTHDEFRKFIASDPALERRFTPVAVN